MADQVSSLNKEPKHFQVGEPNAPCGGCSTCADCCVSMIIYHETRKIVSAHDIRAVAAPAKIGSAQGLNGSECLVALDHWDVRGYGVHYGVTAEDAIRATDAGIVLVAVGYNGFPSRNECEVGGRTDFAFNGAHAITLWGRRLWTKPQGGSSDPHFKPGWRVWTRDPDHHWGDKTPPYDRMRSSFLVRAMDSLIGNDGWHTTMMVSRDREMWHPKLATPVEPHFAKITPAIVVQEPVFGSGQQG